MKKERKAWLCAVLVLLGVMFAAVLGYLAYVFADYSRVEDNLELEIVTEAVPAADGFTTVAPLKGKGPETDRQYRIVSANVGFGAYSADFSFFMDGGKESRARSAEEAHENILGIASVIAAEEPEFVLVQELDIDGTRSCHVDQREDMKTAFAGREVQSVFAQNYDSSYLFYPVTSPIGANLSGIMTYSVFPATSSVRHSLPVEEGLMKIVDLDRCYSVTRVPMENGKELLLYNLHLSAYTSDGTIAIKQLKLLCDDMNAEYRLGNWCVAGGDFNKDLLGNSPEIFGVATRADGSWAQAIPEGLIPDTLTLVAPCDPERPVASCRTASEPYDELTSFRVTVDGFLVSENVKVMDASVLDTGYAWSDHNPVRMDFVLKENAA